MLSLMSPKAPMESRSLLISPTNNFFPIIKIMKLFLLSRRWLLSRHVFNTYAIFILSPYSIPTSSFHQFRLMRMKEHVGGVLYVHSMPNQINFTSWQSILEEALSTKRTLLLHLLVGIGFKLIGFITFGIKYLDIKYIDIKFLL